MAAAIDAHLYLLDPAKAVLHLHTRLTGIVTAHLFIAGPPGK